MINRGDGYMPHAGMKYFCCPKCGCERFKTVPQAVRVDATVWTWEYTCMECGQGMGLTVIR